MTDLENPPERTPLDIVRWANEDGVIGFAHPGKGQNDWWSYPSDLRAIREAQRLGYIVFKKDLSVPGQQRETYEVTLAGMEALALEQTVAQAYSNAAETIEIVRDPVITDICPECGFDRSPNRSRPGTGDSNINVLAGPYCPLCHMNREGARK